MQSFIFSIIVLTFLHMGATIDDNDADLDIFGLDVDSCGRNKKLDLETRFIFRDPEATNPPGSWPWAVSLGQKTGPTSWRHRCGGALINKMMVLTAAHCPLELDTDIRNGNLYVRAGDNDLQDPEDDGSVQLLQVTSYEVHPQYVPRSANYYDIAVLHLERPAVFTEAVRAICLPTESTSREEDTQLPLVVTAWGEDIQGQSGKQLAHANVQVFSEEFCNLTHVGQRRAATAVPHGFTDELFCGGDNAGNSGVCFGDSGSPAVLFQPILKRYLLKGVVSGGIACGTEIFPNIYIRVSDETILSWLKNQLSPVVTPSPPASGEDPEFCNVVDCSVESSEAYCPIKCSSDDQVVFVVGGVGLGRQDLRSTEVLDVTSSTCSRPTTDIPVERTGNTVNYVDGEVIVCGGSGTTRFKSCVSTRSPSGPWLPHSTTNARRWRHSSVFAGGRLHLVGGFYSAATMETLEGNTWTLHELPYAVGQDSCSVQTATNEFVVTGGGGSPSKMSKWGEGNEWTRLDDMIVGRYYHGCTSVTIKGVVHVVVARGRDSSGNDLSSSAMYNMDTGVWTNIGQLGGARSGGMMVNVRAGAVNRVLFMGGLDDGGHGLSSVEELLIEEANVAESTWQLLRTQLTSLKEARYDFGAIAVPKPTFC